MDICYGTKIDKEVDIVVIVINDDKFLISNTFMSNVLDLSWDLF